MCPCLNSRDKYAICCKSGSDVGPEERRIYCLGVYELCPIFIGFISQPGEVEASFMDEFAREAAPA